MKKSEFDESMATKISNNSHFLDFLTEPNYDNNDELIIQPLRFGNLEVLNPQIESYLKISQRSDGDLKFLSAKFVDKKTLSFEFSQKLVNPLEYLIQDIEMFLFDFTILQKSYTVDPKNLIFSARSLTWDPMKFELEFEHPIYVSAGA